MTEDDWDILLKWNSDPEVLYYSEGDNITSRNLEEVQGIYRWVSQTAFCFMIEVGGMPIGECWLQRMNLERILEKYPNADCRRIDLMIGEKAFWGQGLGACQNFCVHKLSDTPKPACRSRLQTAVSCVGHEPSW